MPSPIPNEDTQTGSMQGQKPKGKPGKRSKGRPFKKGQKQKPMPASAQRSPARVEAVRYAKAAMAKYKKGC